MTAPPPTASELSAAPPGDTPKETPKVAPDKLTVTLKPRRDRRAPFVFRATATLAITKTIPATACQGIVTITAKAGKRTIVTQRPALRLKNGSCRAAARITIRNRKKTGKARKLKVAAAFAGNALLTPITGKAVTARIA